MTDSLTLITVGLALTTLVAVVAAAVWWWRSRRLTPAERERRRRLRLHRMGRIAEGRVVEVLNGSGLDIGAEELVVYNYEVRGVEYQAARDVSFLRHKLELGRVASGRTASIKYDPQNPSNSIILSEEWSGL